MTLHTTSTILLIIAAYWCGYFRGKVVEQRKWIGRL